MTERPERDAAPDAVDERLYDEYLDAAMRGELLDPEAFLADRGNVGALLALRLEEMYAVLHEQPAQGGDEPHRGGPGLATVADADMPWEQLGGFRLLRRLGGGGMGMVFLAEQVSLGRLVALKTIRPGASASANVFSRFDREARALAQIQHPNVVAVHGYGEDQGVRYIAMELVPGRDLAAVLRDAAESEQLVPPSTSVQWAAQIAEALACAHAAGILHRDIKPSNIRITNEGRAVLVDFGLARELQAESQTVTESFTGSPAYASPEQVRGEKELDAGTDVYSLGVTVYQCITGQVPFEDEGIESLFMRILHDDPPPARALNRAIPRDLDVVLAKAMEKSRARRYSSAAEFASDLKAVAEFRPISARPPGAWIRTWKWARRNPAMAAAMTTAGLAIVGMLGLLVVQAELADRQRLRQAREALFEARALVDGWGESATISRAHVSEVAWLREQFTAAYINTSEIEQLDRSERLVDEEMRRREENFHRVLESLRRAEVLDPAIKGTDEVRAKLYIARLKGAMAAMDTAAVKVYEQALDHFDPDGTLRREAFPLGELRFEITPPDTEVHVFRYRMLSELVPDGPQRLVPTTLGEQEPVVPPGSWALRVVEGAGAVERGDHIVELQGRPIEGTVLVADVGRGEHGVQLFDRLVSVDGKAVSGDWELDRCRRPLPADAGSTPVDREFLFERSGGTFSVRAPSLADLDLIVMEPDDLARRGGCRAVVHRNGELFPMVLPAGLDVRTSGTPVMLSPASRVAAQQIPVSQGSYVVVLRRSGYETQRLAIEANPEVSLLVRAELLPLGTTPPGFVYVAPATDEGPQPFWGMEREVTCVEYLQFLDDPQTRATIDASPVPILFPRESGNALTGGYWRRDAAGLFELADGFRPDWPVLGISWHDAVAFAAWRTDQARGAGLPYRFRLPTRVEFLAMAGHAGSNFYIYGPTFRPHWTNTCFSRPVANPEPVLRYPIDVSSLGVYDMGGGVLEWLDAWFDEGRDLRHAAGGSWGQTNAETLKVTGGFGIEPDLTTGETGMRLVLDIEGLAR